MKRFIYPAICLVLVLILGIVFLWPKYQIFQIYQKNIEEKRIELQSREAYFSQLEEIFKKFQEYPESLTKISSALPEETSIASLFNFFQNKSAQTGLILEEIALEGINDLNPQPGEPAEKLKGLKEICLRLQLLGSYPAFKDFLLILEESARLIEIKSISLLHSPKEISGLLSFKVKIKTYSY